MAATWSCATPGCALSVARPAAARARNSARSFLYKPDSAPGFLGIGGDLAIAVDIGGERHVTQFRQLVGAALGVVVQSHPFMHDQHARQRSLGVLGSGQITDQPGIALPIFDGFGFDGGLGQGRRQPAQQQQQ